MADSLYNGEGRTLDIGGESYEKIKTFLIGTLVNGGGGVSGVLSPSNTRASMQSVVNVPYVGVKFKFTMPSAYRAVIVSGNTSYGLGTDSGWIYNGDTYTMPTQSIYMRIMFVNNANPSTTISPSVVMGLIESGAIKVEYENKDTLNVIERNRSAEYYAQATKMSVPNDINGIVGDMMKKTACFSHISDVHGDTTRFHNFLEYSKHIGVDACIVTGDSVGYKYGNGSLYQLDNLKDVGGVKLITSMGNHEVNNAVVGSNTTIFNDYISPYVAENGYLESANTPTTKPYYYVDFADKAMRVIALNPYDCAIYGGNGKSGRVGQEQITWFVNTLKNTPDGYGILVLMHSVEDAITTPNEYKAFRQQKVVTSYNSQGQYVNIIRPISKIIDAFINKGTYTATYTEKDSNGTDDAESVTINADFTDVDSTTEFIAYLCGHKHEDTIGYLTNSAKKQLVLLITSGNSQYGTDYYALANQEDLPRGGVGVVQDAFNIYGIDRINKLVKIARIGSCVTYTMTERKGMSISYV